jgi:Tol biopolymer transport system component
MTRRVLAALLSAGLFLPATALAVADGGIEIVDRPSGFGPLPFDGINYAQVSRHGLSSNGCFVVIESENDVLSALDDDAEADIFRVDRCTPGHPAVLVSATQSGVPADGGSFSPSISADGQRVAFTTNARNLLPPGTTVNHAVVVKDLTNGSVVVASRGHGANSALADAFRGVISGDGSAVAFGALGAVDANNATGVAGEADVYVRYLSTFTTRMASVTKTANARGGADQDFDISHDGMEVAFITRSGLDSSDSDGGSDVYLARNMLSVPIQVDWLSYTVGNTGGAQDGVYVAISGDGTRVAFTNNHAWVTTCAPNCGVSDPLDGVPPPTGAAGNFGIGFPAGTATPTHVFWSTDRSLVAADTDTEYDLYVRALADLTTAAGLSRPVPHPAAGVGGGDVRIGDVAVFDAADPALPGTDGVRGQVFAHASGQTTLLSLPEGETRRGETYDTSLERRHSVAQDGRFVVMPTPSPGLGAPSFGPGQFWEQQILVRDVVGGTTTLASAGDGGAPANAYTTRPSIDALGDRVAFHSLATNLVPGSTLNANHVYLRDLATGAMQRVDRKDDGGAPAGGAHDPALSGDGTKVVFISNSPDLPAADGSFHVYLADPATGTTVLVDRTTAGVVADGPAYDADVSADGSRVAFISVAKNLGGFATGDERVFVKDVASGALTFASVPESGTPPVAARGLSLSGDAGHVAWVDDSPGFGYGSDGFGHVFVRDLAAGATTLSSTGGATGTGAYEQGGELDRTGTHLAFVRSIPGQRPVPLLRDLGAGATTDLLPGRRLGGFEVSVSPDGHCVAVNSKSPDVLATGNPSPDFDHVYLIASGADCPRGAGAGAGAGPGAGGVADTTPPVITSLRMSRTRFTVAKGRTALSAKRAKRGSAFLFSLSENARVSIAIAQALPGRRKGARCVRPRKGLKRRCTRYAVLATLTRSNTRQGAAKVTFSGRIGNRKLRPGRYRATLGAVDAAGNRAIPRRVSFRVVRR